MHSDTSDLSGNQLSIKGVLTINTTIKQVRYFNDFKTSNILDVTRFNINESRVVSHVRKQRKQDSRVYLRCAEEVPFTTGNIVLSHGSASAHQTFNDLLTKGGSLSRDTCNIASTNTSSLRLTSTIRNSSSSEYQVGSFGQHSSVSSKSQSLTHLTAILSTHVIMVHSLVNISDEHIRGQQTVNRNDLLIVFNLNTLVIKVSTGGKILSGSTAHHREGSGLTITDSTDNVLINGLSHALESTQDFTSKDFQEACPTITTRKYLTGGSKNRLSRHRNLLLKINY